MTLPKELDDIRERKIWLCYPMIYNAEKHNGVGGYDKPPINAYTMKNGSTDNPEHLATFDEAVARIGESAYVHSKNYTGSVEVVGVGIALGGTGIVAYDGDNVADREKRITTREAWDIVELLDTYTEYSPSGLGIRCIAYGELPANIKKIAKPKKDIFKTEKAEYQLFDSGYVTITGDIIGKRSIAERTDQIAEMYERFFREVQPIDQLSTQRPRITPPVVSSGSGFTYERWLTEVRRLSDAEILERIFKSDRVGERVQRLYYGDTGDYSNDHSRADQALCTFLYGFTNDRSLTERLFRSSNLYRATGKSRNYLNRTLNKAESECVKLIGHIEFTAEEKRAYAAKKKFEEQGRSQTKRRYNSMSSNSSSGYQKRYNSYTREESRNDRRKI